MNSFFSTESYNALRSMGNTPLELKQQFPGFYNDDCYDVLSQSMTFQNKISEDQIERIVKLTVDLCIKEHGLRVNGQQEISENHS